MKQIITLTTPIEDLVKSIQNPFAANPQHVDGSSLLVISKSDDFHVETVLPFSEANKLLPGNANVRAPKPGSRPYRKMLQTVESSPQTFHHENRGIVFVCDDIAANETGISVSFDDTQGTGELAALGGRYGIADGGHTFAVIAHTVERLEKYREIPGWVEPYVRVKFMSSRGIDIERVVEALNTSTQVKDYTLDDYRSEFDNIKHAFEQAGVDPSDISWRENDAGKWDVRGILQRLACFLPEKPNIGPRIYKSRQSALRMFIENREQFTPLLPLVKDLAFLPELIEAQFSSRENVKQRMRLGSLRVARTLPKEIEYPFLGVATKYTLDLAATLPIAASFREFLSFDNGYAEWEVDHTQALANGAEDYYRALTDTLSTVTGNISSIGFSQNYWTNCSNIALRIKASMLKPKTRTART